MFVIPANEENTVILHYGLVSEFINLDDRSKCGELSALPS